MKKIKSPSPYRHNGTLTVVAGVLVIVAGGMYAFYSQGSKADDLTDSRDPATVLSNATGLDTSSMAADQVDNCWTQIDELLVANTDAYGVDLQTQLTKMQGDSAWDGRMTDALGNQYFGSLLRGIHARGTCVDQLMAAATATTTLADVAASASPGASASPTASTVPVLTVGKVSISRYGNGQDPYSIFSGKGAVVSAGSIVLDTSTLNMGNGQSTTVVALGPKGGGKPSIAIMKTDGQQINSFMIGMIAKLNSGTTICFGVGKGGTSISANFRF